MERIIIRNFGPISNVEIEIKDITIFTGRACGKSIVAKLISFFRDEAIKQHANYSQFNELLSDYNIDFAIGTDTLIRYELEEFHCQITKDRIYVSSESHSKGKSLNPIYIPAERIFFPTILQSIFGLISNDIALPKWFLDFGDKFEKARNTIKEISIDFLNVSYEYQDRQDYIKLSNGVTVRLSQASSGLQSVIPLILVIQYNASDKNKNRNVFVVEEPELNLYPSSQKDLTEFIVEATNQSKDKLIITTHSPYLLTTLDNLIQANNVGKLHPQLKKEVSKLVPEKYWINYEKVSCYFFDNGTARSTMDEETQSIGPSNIDNVSERLSETFEKLLALKYQES